MLLADSVEKTDLVDTFLSNKGMLSVALHSARVERECKEATQDLSFEH
jgi:hypothetical protein